MSLNIKNEQVVALAREVAEMANESQTEAIRVALQERKLRLGAHGKRTEREQILKWLREDVWPKIPPELRGKPISKEEQDEILGFGPHGV